MRPIAEPVAWGIILVGLAGIGYISWRMSQIDQEELQPKWIGMMGDLHAEVTVVPPGDDLALPIRCYCLNDKVLCKEVYR
jgi:hypothetical protein